MVDQEENSTELELEMGRMLSGGTDAFGARLGFSLQAQEDDARQRQRLYLLGLIPVLLAIVAYYTS